MAGVVDRGWVVLLVVVALALGGIGAAIFWGGSDDDSSCIESYMRGAFIVSETLDTPWYEEAVRRRAEIFCGD